MDISPAPPKDCSRSCFDFDRTTRLFEEGTRDFTHMAFFPRQESHVSHVTTFQDKAIDRSFEFLNIIHRFEEEFCLVRCLEVGFFSSKFHKSEKFLRWGSEKHMKRHEHTRFNIIFQSKFFCLLSQRNERSILKLHSYSISWRCSSSSYRNCHRSSI